MKKKKTSKKVNKAHARMKYELKENNNNTKENKALKKNSGKISDKAKINTIYNERIKRINNNKIKKLEFEKNKLIKENQKEKSAKIDKKIDQIKNKTEIKRINKLNKTTKGDRDVAFGSDNSIIKLKNVSKIYTTKSLIFNALKDIELEISKGDFVVILGPSGSGKSTLLNIISGLDRATEGDIIVAGKNI